MKTAGVTELKARLSAFLKHVKAGHEVLVTERGAPVARLVPVGGAKGAGDDLTELERQGLVRRGTGVLPTDFWRAPRPADPKGRTRRAVADQREGGW